MDINKDLQFLIGKKISEIRLKNKQNQQDIEFLTNIDVAEISKYETGKRNLTLKTLTKFALALRIHPQELFNFDFDIKKYQVDE
ncbi:Helix-turn-helix [Chryseobacterium rhizoplanae]|uniref:Helix-turn-helix n=1 Tax=Chryseobacterium rhizoplanae TaxID=1609531 RepID=A0A521AM33_9FLAO|nr:helix-turn-helix transcriptional regulator [Chryseobacterium rhizoplanae]SMO35852.1 Helix-turn-helix [Chryseobacterium rhizoplanae]